MFAVIAENDESEWNDDTGKLYNFPKRYHGILAPGTQVVYYKGKLRDSTYKSSRLSPDPHYFGTAVIGTVYADPASSKGDFFAVIEDFEKFKKAVPNKVAGSYYEVIPHNRESNYWRDGVRAVTAETYGSIVDAS